MDEPRPSPRTEPKSGMSWLADLGHDALDPGYAAAAERRQHGDRGRSNKAIAVLWVVAAMVVAGVVIGVAVRSNQINEPDAAKARAGLLADVDRAQQRAGELEATASALTAQIRTRQQALGAGDALQSVEQLQVAAAMTAVDGPGLSVLIDRSGSSTVILDRDVQLLVNGLWAAGAEAITVGGVRLRATSAIRQAGGAILVDNKPTFWPITIQAIGSPNSMHVAFAQTAGYGRFAAYAANYGITFTVSDVAELSMPAAAALERSLSNAEAPPEPSTTNGNPVSSARPTTRTSK